MNYMNDLIQGSQTKICTGCEQDKPLTEFYKRSAGRKGYQAWCKSCNKLSRVRQTQINKYRAIKLLGGKCSNPTCAVQGGYHRSSRALHFHHPDPLLKDDMFHRLRNRSWEHIKATLIEQRVELLCANCHAEHHGSDDAMTRSKEDPHFRHELIVEDPLFSGGVPQRVLDCLAPYINSR